LKLNSVKGQSTKETPKSISQFFTTEIIDIENLVSKKTKKKEINFNQHHSNDLHI